MHKEEPEPEPPKYIFDEEQNLYNCNTCGAEFLEKTEVEEHVETHVIKFKCEFCEEVYTDAYKFSTHVYDHNGVLFQCPLCPHATIKRSCILSHIKRMHLRKFKYHCKICGKADDDKTRHFEHELSHEANPPQFLCIVCNKSFPYSRYLSVHQVRYHHVKICRPCELCEMTFPNNKSYIRHFKTHIKDRPSLEKNHLCDICGKGYARLHKLKSHYRTHTGSKPFSCSYCGKSFTTREYLVLHERIHSGVKPYKCEYCGKRFNQDASHRIHVRTHTGERPYVCQFCKGGFVSRAALNSHLKTCKGNMSDDY